MNVKVGDVVWFRMGRMHGYPPQAPTRAMVEKVHANGYVDLEIGCEGVSQLSGSAARVAHRDSLPPALREQQACYWTETMQGDNPQHH
jgi:hypothetical protein